MKWLFWSLRMTEKEWDLSTITAEDYTIEMDLEKWEYKMWWGVYWGVGNDNKKDKNNNVSPMYSLKWYL